ncbi:hypothetical protein WI604_31205 [Bradyrhizobium symbiodeficiens]|uniref:hypothetical protein n=1 Tax=Bradyrhizobium symbiodeficiens TaxID=1404367 RepID=UPI0030CC3B26
MLNNPKIPGPNETQTTPVQPDRTPQQSDQTRERERKNAEDTRVKRDWTTQRDEDRSGMDRMRQQHMGRMDRRSRYGDEDRPRRRVKICFEYENGDEFCRYRD